MSTAPKSEASEIVYIDPDERILDPKALIAVIERRKDYPTIAEIAQVLREVEALGEAAKRVRGVPPAWAGLREYARSLLHSVHLTLEVHGGEEFRDSPGGVYPITENRWVVLPGKQRVDEDRREFRQSSAAFWEE